MKVYLIEQHLETENECEEHQDCEECNQSYHLLKPYKIVDSEEKAIHFVNDFIEKNFPNEKWEKHQAENETEHDWTFLRQSKVDGNLWITITKWDVE